MTRRDLLGKVGGAILGAGLAPRIFSAPQRPPNFVFILIDDMGWKDLGCFGSQYHETPNIDKLAASGIRFTDFYAAAPVCSPTRASILTGKYPARTGVTGIIPSVPPLKLSEVTVAERLRAAGYTGASIGKWHLGGKGFFPEDQGFNTNIGGSHIGMAADFFYPAWTENRWGPKVARGPVPVPGDPGDYLTDRLTKEAVNFIQENKDNPFFLYLSHYAVHTPIQSKPPVSRKYRRKLNIRFTQNNPVYAAMVEAVDDSVGAVLEKLTQLGLDDNTTVIFTSDNGGLSTWDDPNTPATSNAPLLGGKGHLYEGGIRVPAIIRSPGVSKAGTVSNVPAISNDFFPTMLEIAGLRLDPQDPVDGRSLLPLLKGADKLDREALYWHYPHRDIDAAEPGGVIRRGDYKLIEFYADHRLELYDLKKDIGESTNLSAKMPDLARKLHRMLDAWRNSLGVKAEIGSRN